MVHLGLMSAAEVAATREKIKRLEYKIAEAKKIAQSRLNGDCISREKMRGGFYGDDGFDQNIRYHLEAKKTLSQLKEQLLSNRYSISLKNNECIQVGSCFSVSFLDSDFEEQFQIVDVLDGTSSLDGYISKESPFAQSVLGKGEGEEFSYTINHQKVEGKIVKIHLEEETRFLLDSSLKFSSTADKDKEASMIITPSQFELLQEFETRLKRISSTFEYKALLFYIRGLINSCCITHEPVYVEKEANKRIGYGTSFSIQIHTHEEVQNKRLEMIHQAFSTETDREYIEKVDILGQYIYGLKENDKFSICELGLSGVVYDVDNTYYKVRFCTYNPLVYRKNKR